MKKNILSTLSLILLLTIHYSCQSDDNEITTPETQEEIEENVDLSTVINAITNGSEAIWKIESAQLTNATTIFDIEELYSVNDDEFIFSTDTDSSIQLRHRRGYRINSDAQDTQGLKSDVRVAPINTTLHFENTTNFQFADASQYRFDYNESNQTITGLYIYPNGATLSITLTQKEATDYEVAPTSIGTLSEIIRIEGNQPVLDMKYSFTTQSLYMTNRKSTNEQQLIKYDVFNGSSLQQTKTGGDYLAQQLAFIDDKVVTISSNEINRSNLDLSGNVQTTTLGNFNGEFDYRTVTLENQIFKIGGHNGLGLDAISILNEGDTSFTLNTVMENEKTSVGAEIIDNKLYVVGGFTFDNQGTLITYDEIVTYDLENNMQTDIIALPANLIRTYTARYENLVYIAGRKQNAPGEAITNYLSVYNTVDTSFQEIDISEMLPSTMVMREMTVSNSKIYFAIQVLGSFDPFEISILEATLN